MRGDLNRSGGDPLYLQIYDGLRQRIVDGEWQHGETLPSEPELCQVFGVARGTVRQALAALETNGYISRQRGRGTYVTWNRSSVRPARSRVGQIGFVVPYVRDSYVTTILLGVERAASDQGLSVTFKHVDNSLEKQAAVVQELVEHGCAGIIVYPVDSIHASPLDDLIRTGYPIVLVDRYLRGVASDYVISDHFGGALRATQHLVRLGHRHIGFVTWADPAISMEHRLAGYQRALSEAGLPADPARILEVASYPAIDKAALKDFLLRNANGMTAAFAANDQIALAIYEAARQAGIRIPEALAVVGFDDLEFTSHLDVPLTTVAQSAFTIGEQAVEALLRRLRGEVVGWQQIILPTRLVIRESCGFKLGPRVDAP
jgi:GntR family transcriptional regulator of arabinose operon